EEGAQMAHHVRLVHPHEHDKKAKLCRYTICDFRANDSLALSNHEKLPHAVSQENFCLPPLTTCPYCDTNIESLVHYKCHMLSQHHELMFSKYHSVICVACSFKCAGVFEMIWHWQQKAVFCCLGMRFNYEAAGQKLMFQKTSDRVLSAIANVCCKLEPIFRTNLSQLCKLECEM
ncbi:hypothetical protein PFISCL1PPCAC_4426, partial [Pristionchus fissidentatus]